MANVNDSTVAPPSGDEVPKQECKTHFECGGFNQLCDFQTGTCSNTAPPTVSAVLKNLELALDHTEQKCMVLRENLAVCGPVPRHENKEYGITVSNELFVPPDEIQDKCYTVMEYKNLSGQKAALQVCAPSRKEAHLELQNIGTNVLQSKMVEFLLK